MNEAGMLETGWIPQLGYGVIKGKRVDSSEEYISFIEGELRANQSALQATIERAEVTWRSVYPNKLAHTDDDKNVYDAAWLANSLEQLLAAERRASIEAEAALDEAKEPVVHDDSGSVALCRRCGFVTWHEKDGEVQHETDCELAHIEQTQGSQP